MKHIGVLIFLFFLMATSNANDVAEEALKVESYIMLLGVEKNILLKKYTDRISETKIQKHDWVEVGLQYIENGRGFLIELKDGYSRRLSFYLPAYSTMKGVKVNDRYCEVLGAYPDAQLKWGYDEGGYIRLYDIKAGLLFKFNTKYISWDLFDSSIPPSIKNEEVCASKLVSIHLEGM